MEVSCDADCKWLDGHGYCTIETEIHLRIYEYMSYGSVNCQDYASPRPYEQLEDEKGN